MAFKIAAAQVASVRGEIEANVAIHAAAMLRAVEHGVTVLVFPELSLTGYEPELAASLAMTPTDARLSPLVDLARRHDIETVVGAPLLNGAEMPALGAIVVTSRGAPKAYRKMHLGGTEPRFFLPGRESLILAALGQKVGLAICADSSRDTHPETYAAQGAGIYATGVFLNAEWYEADAPRLGDHARRFHLLTVMANHGASIGSHESVGRSAIWAPGGALLVQASGTESVLLIASLVDGDWRAELVDL